ncbi:Polyphosphate kinase 2 superfamily [Verrucomicrobiia bacterium DG1235]|nr:Polyphosphate kinase 2 superfamily [Verrucomicrobiae bacterium DG1235]
MNETIEYRAELKNLQRELVLLQQHIAAQDNRLLIIFEGRDAAGKGGAIRHFTRHLNPRAMRVRALPKPTETELGQWYFQRYLLGLPNPGEIIFFDRSWYNRAVVEPVMGFCSTEQYEEFMGQVNDIEKMLINDGIQIIKFWFSINRSNQQGRFEARKSDVLKQWKLSTVDALAQEKWDEFTFYKEQMFERTHTIKSPWVIINGNNKEQARLESIRYVLSQCEYDRKGEIGVSLKPAPKIVKHYDLAYLEAKRASDKL